MDSVFSIEKPDNPLPLIFDSPHSGIFYPAEFHFDCTREDQEHVTDKYVDELFACAPEYGGAFLKALFPRTFVDVNRAEDDIDPALLGEEWPEQRFGRIRPTGRSDAGIGLVWRLVKPGIPIYNHSLSPGEIDRRIRNYYRPYHAALQDLIDQAHYNFGQVWHINCHSMPVSSAVPRRREGELSIHEAEAVDFCLGDRDGTTAPKAFTHAVRDFLKGRGYAVSINDPFRGVELVRRHAAPAHGRYSLQLEINKSLYMDEDTRVKNANYGAFKTDIEALVKFMADYVQSNLTQMAAD